MTLIVIVSGVLLSGAHAAAVSAEDIATRTQLRTAFDSHFFPERVEGSVHLTPHDGHDERVPCLTGLVQSLKDNWHLFDAADREEMTGILAPWKNDLLDGMEGPPVPAPGSCFGYQTGDNYIDTEHFSVQWDSGTISEATAQEFADSLEYSWSIEVDELGWRQPAGTSRYQMLVKVQNMGGGGAYTTVDWCGGEYQSYVVASSGSFSTGSWYKTMACHELHHAIQYAHGFSHEFWFWEATSTWVEDLVYPSLNDWMNAVQVYSLVPYIGLNADANGGSGGGDYLFYHTYAMGIFGMFLDQHVGGNDLMKDVWNESVAANCQYCLWLPDAINDAGEDFDAVYAEFLATNAVMEYNDRMWLRTPTLTDDVSSLPTEGESSYEDRPQSLGHNFIRFDGDLAGSGKALEVTFDGENIADYWIAVLVRGEMTVDEYVVFELDDEYHNGTARIAFDGEAPIHLVVTPVYEDAQGYDYNWGSPDDFDYEWTAEIVDDDGGGAEGEGEGEGEGVGGGGEYSGPSSDLGGSTEDLKGGYCGCASTATDPWRGWLGVMLMGLVAVGRRRD